MSWQWVALIGVGIMLACRRVAGDDNYMTAAQMAGNFLKLADVDATAELAKDVIKLQQIRPLKRPVAVVVIRDDVRGWLEGEKDGPARRIIIIDDGHASNRRSLAHEWEHQRQRDAGEPENEDLARAAESF